MNIYLVERTDENGYDEFDSFVCIEETLEKARQTTPNDKGFDYHYNCWTHSIDNVKATKVGTALKGATKGIICSSYNAG
jgi:hypothetical protein